MDKVKAYILQNFPRTIRFCTEEKEERFALPYRHTTPCADEFFTVMYYWDTYFTNVGLYLADMGEIAGENVLNLAHLCDRFGYIPNGACKAFLGRSQPPYLALMAREHFAWSKDEEWLKKLLPSLKREYAFWQTERRTENGLNRYSGQAYDDKAAADMYEAASVRLKKRLGGDRATVGRHYLAEAESGWDFCARFEGRCMDFNPVDLNSNLYLYEVLLAEWSELFGEDGSAYRKAAEARKAKINALFRDEKGIYFDYCHAENRRGTYPSAAGFHPYFVGLAPKEDAAGLTLLLQKLERAHGVSAGAPADAAYQWGDPNVWAPLQYVAVKSLENYGLRADARRVAQKYVETVRTNYEKSGGLYEKYNGDTGGNDAVSEYGTPEMLGWTAGVYLALLEFLEN